MSPNACPPEINSSRKLPVIVRTGLFSLHRPEGQDTRTKCWHENFTQNAFFHFMLSSLIVVITAALVASYAITDFFLFTVALVFTNITFVPATIPFILTFVRPTTFLASILTIIIICKLLVLMGTGRRSPEWVCMVSGTGLRLDQRQQDT